MRSLYNVSQIHVHRRCKSVISDEKSYFQKFSLSKHDQKLQRIRSNDMQFTSPTLKPLSCDDIKQID